MTIDRNVEPQHGVPLWSETRWNGCWNGDDGVGIYLHAGRYRHDLDIWWAQVVAYLPDGIGFKDHSSGPRDFASWFAHRYVLIVADDWTCHAVVMYSPEGEPLAPWGAFLRDGRQSAITRFELPPLEDSAGGPVHGPL